MRKLLLSLLFLVAFAANSKASHVMGGDITYTCLGGNQYQVTLTLYRDCSGITIGTTPQTVSFTSSCGTFTSNLDWVSTTNVSQVCPTQTTTCNGGTIPGTEQYIFTGIVTLPPCVDWIMSWNTCCRNGGISNLTTPDSQDLYVQSTLNNVAGACNNSPQFLALPTPYLCPNQLTIYNHGASDIDGDSLYYSFTSAFGGTTPPGTPLTYTAGYSPFNPILTTSGLNLNQQTGEMCFTPSVTQICVVSVIIYEYRNNVLIGTQIREMQVVVSNSCSNSAPYAGAAPTCGNTGGMTITYAGPSVVQNDANSLSMCPNDSLCFQISFTDPDGNNVTVNSNIASAIPGANFTIANNGTTNPIGYFCWVPTPLDTGINVLTVNLLDDACPISASQYYTYDITVFDQPYAGLDQTICGPQWADLQASNGAGYTWSVISGEAINPGVNITCTNCANTSVKPSITTTYLLTSTLTNACVNTDTVTVNVVPDYTLSHFGDTTLCDYLSTPIGVVVNPSTAGYTVSWSNSGTLSNGTSLTPNASPTASTTYVATVTSPFGCVKSDSVTVNVTPPPTLTVNPGDTTICLGSSVNFGIESTCLYTLEMEDNFGDGWNGQTISVYDNGVFVGTYTVASTDNNGEWNTVTFPITNGNTITLVYGTGSYQSESSFNLIDGQGNTQFSVTAGNMSGWVDGNTYYTGVGNCGPTLSSYSFNWTPTTGLSNPNIQNPVASPTTTTTYTVTLSNAGGCTINRTQTVTVVPTYTLTTTQSASTVCLGETVNFTATTTPAGTFNYSWTPANIFNNPTSPNPTATFITSGLNTIIVNVDNGGGCQKSDTMYVQVSPAYAPNINIVNNDTAFGCSGTSPILINLDLGGGIPATCGPSATPACSGSSSTISIGNSTGANTSTSWPAPYGNYYRNAKHQFLFTAAELNAMGFVGGKITQIGWPVATINGTTTYNGYTIKMKCTNITNITSWETGLTQVFNPKIVNVVVGMNMHTLDVAYEWDGISNLLVEICYDNLATSYTNNSITPWVTTAFTSSLYYYSDSSPACPSTTTSGNSTNRPLTFFVTCPTTPDPLAFNYSWTPTVGVSNPTTQNPTLSPTATTTYTVKVTDPVGGCFDTDSITITINNGLTATISKVDADCGVNNGKIIVETDGLNPLYTFEYLDSSGVTILQTNNSPQNDSLLNLASGLYFVRVTDGSGCVFLSDSILIDGLSNLTANATFTPPTCNGFSDGKIVVEGAGLTGPFTIEFYDSTGVTLLQTSTQPLSDSLNNIPSGTYGIIVYDSQGCSFDTTITLNPAIEILITSISNDTSICINTSTIIEATAVGGTGSLTYMWDNGLIGNGSHTVSPLINTTYTVYAQDSLGCISLTDTINIIVNPNATISLTSTLGTDSQTVCINSVILPIEYTIGGGGTGTTITGLPTGVTGNYVAGIMTITGTPTDTGTFNYLVTTIGSCSQVVDSGIITVTPDATISLTSANDLQTVCINEPITDITYSIDGGGTNASVTGLPNGLIGTFNAGVYTISGTPTDIGAFNYTISTSGTCVQVSMSGTITLNDSLDITTPSLSEDSICPNDPTTITAVAATGGSGNGYTYNWFDSNNNVVGAGLSISVTPTQSPETYTLVVGDNCTTPTVSESVTVYWHPVPMPSLSAINTSGCFPVLTSFVNTTPSLANINNVTWNFGDGGNSNDIITTSHQYNTPGCFDVKLTVTSINGCSRDTTYPDIVCAYDYPVADFMMDPQPTDITNPFINFTNQSLGNNENYWSFTGGIPNASFEVNPQVEYPADSAGTYLVELAVVNSQGCTDTTYQTVVINGIYLIYFPNSFTPNGDNNNEVFKPMGEGIDLTYYHFMIFDRWGEKLFETNNIAEGWDGTYKGNPVQSDAYIWKVKAKELYRNVNTEHSGYVNLLR